MVLLSGTARWRAAHHLRLRAPPAYNLYWDEGDWPFTGYMNISVKAEYALQAIFDLAAQRPGEPVRIADRSEEHTSELPSLRHLVCRLLLEKNIAKRT